MKFLAAIPEYCVSLLRRLREHWRQFRATSHPKTLKFEIMVLYTLILGIILIMFSGMFYVILARTLYQELDNELRLKAQTISQNIRSYLEAHEEKEDALKFAVENTIARSDQTMRRWWYIGFERRWFKRLDEQNLASDYVTFVNMKGDVLAQSPNLDEGLLRIFLKEPMAVTGEERLKDISFQKQKLRLIMTPFTYKEYGHYLIQVGLPVQPVVLLLQNWMHSVFLIIPIVLLLTSFVGRMLANRILRPVRAIADAATNISRDNLQARVTPQYFYEEMNDLSKGFNDMIDRLEKSFHHIEEFSDHVAHELKTPLTIIRGETEVALMEKRTPAEYQSALKINLEEIDKMLKIVEDLLLLSKLSYQPDIFRFEMLDFHDFLTEIYAQGRILASARNIRLKFNLPEKRINIRADRLHLRRLFFNLIDNAMKFSPPRGEVALDVQTRHRVVWITVSDNGPGIAPENMEKIFERFFRGTHQSGGAGLGLDIAQSIARVHKGSIHAANRPQGGAVFTVRLPIG